MGIKNISNELKCNWWDVKVIVNAYCKILAITKSKGRTEESQHEWITIKLCVIHIENNNIQSANISLSVDKKNGQELTDN